MVQEAKGSTFGEKRARIRAALSGGVRIVYQPVADIRRGAIVGVEALARFADRTPDVWFGEAWSIGLGLELEIEAIRCALAGFDALPPDVYIAVNVAAETLLSHELFELLSAYPGDRIVVELTEHAAVDDYDQLNLAIARLRARGIRLSIDDAGAGISSLQHVLRLRPETIKLDRSLTNGVDENPVLSALASALVTFASSLGATITAEGIETLAQLVSLQKLGVAYGQGYFLARPAPLPLPQLPGGVWTSQEYAQEAVQSFRPSPAVLSPERLAVLRELEILDSVQPEHLDRFTGLAASVVGAPTAIISLVDANRQFFLSAVGLPSELKGARETPLTKCFCQHAVTTRLPFVIEDARSHPLVRENEAVTELGVAAYLGIPLLTADGQAIGAFCAISPTPRPWSTADVEHMKSLASMAMNQIELHAELKRKQQLELLHRQVVARSSSALFVGDIAGEIAVASDGLCKLFERTREEIEGRRVRTFFHPDDLPAGIELHRQLLAGERHEAEVAVRVSDPAGGWMNTRLSWHILRKGSGSAALMVGTFVRL